MSTTTPPTPLGNGGTSLLASFFTASSLDIAPWLSSAKLLGITSPAPLPLQPKPLPLHPKPHTKRDRQTNSEKPRENAVCCLCQCRL